MWLFPYIQFKEFTVSIYSNWAGYLKEQDRPYISMLKNVVKYTARPPTIKRIVNRFIQGNPLKISYYVIVYVPYFLHWSYNLYDIRWPFYNSFFRKFARHKVSGSALSLWQRWLDETLLRVDCSESSMRKSYRYPQRHSEGSSSSGHFDLKRPRD